MAEAAQVYHNADADKSGARVPDRSPRPCHSWPHPGLRVRRAIANDETG
jgi:hypothetical protein